MRRSDLAGRRVVVWGMGGEGRAAARTARAAGAADVLAVVDGQPGQEALARWAADGLDGVPAVPVAGHPGEGALENADIVILSPGVSRYRPEVLSLEAGGAAVTNGTELFLAEQGGRTVAVTGSKGKSTVTQLTTHLLAAAGQQAASGGNIGAALLDLLPMLPAELPGKVAQGPLVVAEVSSYQAALVGSPPRVAVLTSLFPDHLPWHGSVERYYADKLRIFAAQLPGPRTALVNGEDAGVRSVLGEPALAAAVPYGSPDARVRVVGAGPDGVVIVGNRPVLPLRRSRLPGTHNAVNVAAAVAVLDALGVDVAARADVLGEALGAFAPLPHRLEPVATIAGVTYVDDSLATSAQAAVAACEAFPGRPLTLLVGGLDRGIDYDPLVSYLTRRAGVTPLTVVAMGAAGRRVAAGLRDVEVETTDDVADAVGVAAAATTAGGIVLFSPAAASPPEYGTYERRSAVFAEAVRSLAG